jgi:hypothetical protein
MSSWKLTVITLLMFHWSRLHYNWLLTQHKLIFINQQHMRVSFSSDCSTFLLDVAHLKRYINISGIHLIPVGKVFYPYPTRCISGIQPDSTHGWVFVPVSISGGYETRGYPYPRVQLPSLFLSPTSHLTTRSLLPICAMRKHPSPTWHETIRNALGYYYFTS